MNHRLHIHKKAFSQSASTPASNLFQSRPFAAPETATPTPQETPDLQQQQEWEKPRGMNLLEIPNLVAGNSPLPEPPQALGLQAKLTIGEPGDRYEQEADRVAADVVQRIHAPSPQVQREEIESVGDEQMQMSPFVQQWRNALVQRREQESTEEEQIRMSPIGPHWRNALVQRQDVLDEEQVMMKPQVSFLQREEVQELSLKSNIQNPKSEGMGAAPDLEASIQGARGSGQPLDESVREPMEREFGADFSGVKVHTDAKSDQLNQSIQAKAFTTGQDVFFRSGAYDPGSRGGQELLAHELTHVVQQSGGAVQRQTARTAHSNDVPYRTHTPVSPYSVIQRLSSSEATELPTIQCRIAITPDAYARGLGAGTQNLTNVQIKEYFMIAVQDDLNFALKVADEDTKTQLRTRIDDFKAQKTSQGKVDAINQLVRTINTALDNYQIYEDKYNAQGYGESIAIPNRKTRYATEPADENYAHSSLNTNKKETTKWGNDSKMWGEFTKEIAEEVSQGNYDTTQARGKGKLPLQQLPWDEAKRILPKPLINLIFDVRFQLETNGNVVIDQRTPFEQQNKQKSPNAPGTLRSWHQDTPGVLPQNNFDPQNIPAPATALHQHYSQNSQSGAGSSTKNPIISPQGYAEYTGTGSDWEHNTKIVLDYINKRVYLTLTHYQYWALINENGTFKFWNSGGQELAQAEGKLEQELKTKEGSDYIMMSPWVEILMPKGQ
ncbi:MAG: DUF4157 domain-containing protein [Cyanobacteriota bacterium]